MAAILGIVGINILFGAVLGGVTAAVTVPFIAEIGPVVGGVIGLITSPVVVLAVQRKPVSLALPLIYFATIVVSMIAMLTRLPPIVIGLAVLTMGLASLCAWLFLPDAVRRSRDGRVACQACGYGLTGNLSGRCPECGTAVTPAVAVHPANAQFVRLGVSLLLVVVVMSGIAYRQVAAMRPATDVDGLIRQLANNEALVHDPAINELVKRGKEPLLLALQHANSNVRSRAVRGLQRLGDPTTVPDLVRALDDSDPWTRSRAAGALADMADVGDEAVICPLLKLRDDRIADHNVERALESLGVPPEFDPADYGCDPEATDGP